MDDIHTLETERLILRGWRDQDLEPYASIVAEAEVMRYLGGPQTRAAAWQGIAGMIGHWMLRGFGCWAVLRKSDGVLIGRAGLQCPYGWPGLEVTWLLGRAHWGQGYATEAAAACLKFGFHTTSRSSLMSLIHPENLASKRVAERLGYDKIRTGWFELFGAAHEREVWEVSRNRFAS